MRKILTFTFVKTQVRRDRHFRGGGPDRAEEHPQGHQVPGPAVQAGGFQIRVQNRAVSHIYIFLQAASDKDNLLKCRG